MKQIIWALSVMLLVVFTAGGVEAVLLSDLLGGGSVTAGDKLFDSWQLMNYSSSDPSRSFNAANIEVTALNDGDLDPGPGLRFSASGNELTVTGDGIYAFVDLMLGFRVSVLDPMLFIKDNSLTYTAGGAFNSWYLDGSHDVGTYIRETVGTSAGLDDLGIKNIEFSNSDLTGQIAKISDAASFVQQNEIWITKNILVWAVDTTDSAGIFGFEQRYSQTPVPEPGTLSLLGLGLAGAAMLRRGKKNRSVSERIN